MAVSNNAQGNHASGNTLQLNTPISGDVIFNINVFCANTSSVSPPTLTFSTLPRQPRRGLSSSPESASSALSGDPDIRTSIDNEDRRWITLHSVLSGKQEPVRAQALPEFKNSYLSDELSQHLRFKRHKSRKKPKSLEIRGERFLCSGDYVHLSSLEESSGRISRHKFYIVKDVQFDVLLGRDVLFGQP